MRQKSKVDWKEKWVWIYLYSIFIYINAVYVRLTVFGADTSGLFGILLTAVIGLYFLINIRFLKPRFPHIPFKLFNMVVLLMILAYYLSFNIYAYLVWHTKNM